MDFSGSFWDDIDGAGEDDNIHKALASPFTTMETLLGYDEFLQELRANTLALVEFTCRKDSLLTIVKLITEEPPENATEARCFKLPFIANEAICLSVENVMKNFFVDVSNTSPLCSLWKFLQQPKPLNPVLAGYFNRSMEAFLTRHPTQFLTYIHGHPILIHKLFSHLYSHSIADFFQKLMCHKQFFEVVMPVEGLTTNLLQQLFIPEEDITQTIFKERSENVTAILLFLIALNLEIPNGDIPLGEMATIENINFLLKLLTSTEPLKIFAATRILTNVLSHSYDYPSIRDWIGQEAGLLIKWTTNVERKEEKEENQREEYADLSPFSSFHNEEIDDPFAVKLTSPSLSKLPNETVNGDVFDTTSSALSPLISSIPPLKFYPDFPSNITSPPAVLQKEIYQVYTAQFLDRYFTVEILQHLRQLISQTFPARETPPADSSSTTSSPPSAIVQTTGKFTVGKNTIGLLKLVEAMLFSHSQIISHRLFKSGLWKECVASFFFYKWNSALHIRFCVIFRLLLFRCFQDKTLFTPFLITSSFLQKCLYLLRLQRNLKLCTSLMERRQKASLLGGNCSHVAHMCILLQDCRLYSPWLDALLKSISIWSKVLEPLISELKQLHESTAALLPSTGKPDSRLEYEGKFRAEKGGLIVDEEEAEELRKSSPMGTEYPLLKAL